MLRFLSTALRAGLQKTITPNVRLIESKSNVNVIQSRCFGILPLQMQNFPSITEYVKRCTLFSEPTNRNLLLSTHPAVQIPTRTVVKFSLTKGKRKTVKTVLKRFKRLDWGIWIRTIAGRHKHLYKKSMRRKIRAKQHVFCNATQSWLLDTMVTSYWRRPRHYVDDPYNPYHKREEFRFTRFKPLP